MGPPRISAGWWPALWALAWIAGVAWQLRQPEVWSWPVCGASLAVGFALVAAGALRHGAMAALAGAALLGAMVTNGQAALRLAERLAPALEGRDLIVTGVIASLPQRGASGLRFGFDVERAELDGRPAEVPGRIALGWYKGFHDDAALTQPQSELRAGQRWRFTVRLRQPHGNLNPHGFDYELFLFEQGVRATGYVRDAATNQRLADAAGHPVERLRQRVRDAIDANVPDRRAAGVLAALAVGDQSAIALGIDNKVLRRAHL